MTATTNPLPATDKVLTAISAIMGEIGGVEKGGENKHHGYAYATIGDIVQKVQPLMAKNGLVVMQTETERTLIDDGNVLSITYDFEMFHKDSDNEDNVYRLTQTGLSSCRNSKGGFDDKAANKCHTAARKYFLISLFQIPALDLPDADAEEDKGKGKDGVGASGRGRKVAAVDDILAPMTESSAPVGEVSPEVITLLEPQRIAMTLGEVQWGSMFVAAIGAAKNTADIGLWISLNKEILDHMESKAPALAKRIIARVEEAYAKFQANPLSPAVIAILKKLEQVKTKKALENVWHNEIQNAGMPESDMDFLAVKYGENEKRITG